MCLCEKTSVGVEITKFIVEGKTFNCPVNIERCLDCGEEVANAKYAMQNSVAMLETKQ